jgi:small subunit ribosomal protein S26e
MTQTSHGIMKRSTDINSLKQDIKRQNTDYNMPLKRASRGRQKGGKGSAGRIQCTNCGATVPRDKAKKVTSRLNLVEHTLAKELRAQGAYIAAPTVLKWYCISCAIHFGILKIRSAESRRNHSRLR